MEDSNNLATHAQQQRVGLKCPQCEYFIESSVFQLLTASALECPKCHLRLKIDKIKSQKAFEALRKVQVAQQNLERKSKFTR